MFRCAYKRLLRGSRLEMQQLTMLLERKKYIHNSRCNESSKVVTNVFWTHLTSTKLLNVVSIVLLMDTTYKANKYRLSLLEIVDVTST